jgi:hypothetical protein
VLGLAAILVLAMGLLTVACKDKKKDGATATATQGQTAVATEGGTTPTAGVPGRLDITAVDFLFENVPATQPGGLTAITLRNTGAEDHQAQFVRLNEGVTLEQLQTALQSDETGAAALALVTVAGGVNGIAPGDTGEVMYDLTPGNYVMLCFISGADDIPHVAKGMIQPFEVTAPEGDEPQPPAPDAGFTISDFTFGGDKTLAAGPQTVQVINNGPQAHEVTIWKLDEGFTVDMLKAQFTEEQPTPDPNATPEPEGPPPFSSAGGLGAIPVNEDGYMMLNLEAGNYAMLCFVPDQATGAPHAALGMIESLTVE